MKLNMLQLSTLTGNLTQSSLSPALRSLSPYWAYPNSDEGQPPLSAIRYRKTQIMGALAFETNSFTGLSNRKCYVVPLGLYLRNSSFKNLNV